MAPMKRLVRVDKPAEGKPLIRAPPVVQVSSHTTYYLCAGCGTLLVIADEGQLKHLAIHCRICGAYNDLDLSDAPPP
jgi:DNA-directed RNA polymerase subunit RPC12/RpoP